MRSVHLTYLILERKSQIRTQRPYHRTFRMHWMKYLILRTLRMQHPILRTPPHTAPNTQGGTWRQTTSSGDKRWVPPLPVSDICHPGHNRFQAHLVKLLNLLQVGFYCSNKHANSSSHPSLRPASPPSLPSPPSRNPIARWGIGASGRTLYGRVAGIEPNSPVHSDPGSEPGL